MESYWKSNPYLSKEFTGEDDSLHPQWVVVALDRKEDVNAIRIDWAEPYARDFEVQYWVGDGDAMDDQDKGAWKIFPQGSVAEGKGGIETLRMGPSPVGDQVCAHPDDAFFEHLRHSRIRRSSQLRGLCDPRTLSGHAE